jgi:hypothetical protein
MDRCGLLGLHVLMWQLTWIAAEAQDSPEAYLSLFEVLLFVASSMFFFLSGTCQSSVVTR